MWSNYEKHRRPRHLTVEPVSGSTVPATHRHGLSTTTPLKYPSMTDPISIAVAVAKSRNGKDKHFRVSGVTHQHQPQMKQEQSARLCAHDQYYRRPEPPCLHSATPMIGMATPVNL